MKFVSLILKSARRSKRRTALTMISVALAVFLFSALRAVLDGFDAVSAASSATRLVTIRSTSMIFSMPTSHLEAIKSTPDVQDVTYANGFGGKMTTIWPGRPGRAKWASVSADGRSIGIFEGRKKVQTLRIYMGPDDLKKTGYVPRAAFSYVRSIR